MPFWTDAYLGDTSHLTTIEHGAYLLLLITMWRNKAVLPNDDRLLARYARLTTGQWKRIKPIVMPFFEVDGDEIKQGRLTDEYNAVRQYSKKQSDKAKSRWLKTKDEGDAVAVPKDDPAYASPTPTPTPVKKEETNVSSYVKPHPVPSDEIEEAVEHFNHVASSVGWSQIVKITPTRRSSLFARLRDAGGLDDFKAAIDRASKSSFLTGQKTDWQASFDFLIGQKNFTKLIEGNYDDRPGHETPGQPDATLDAIARAARSR